MHALVDPVFLKAMALGFCVAAPIGPVGILCINRSLGSGAVLGLATGLGASTVQVGWILLATAGTAGALILGASPLVAPLASLLAATLLVWMGIRAFRRGGALPTGAKAPPTLLVCLASYASGIMMSVSNPVTGIVFLSAAPSIAPVGTGMLETRVMLAAGTFLGSAVWWTALSGGVAVLRDRLQPWAIGLVNRGAGVLLISLAGMMLTNILRGTPPV
jgi:threonine/homoserine/homoserine lactone efflux protein